MQHETASAPQTAGRVIHWARWYDLFDRVMPFARRIREKLVELAACACRKLRPQPDP